MYSSAIAPFCHPATVAMRSPFAGVLLRVLDRQSRQVERRPRLLEFLRARVSQRHPHVPGTLLCAAPRLIEVQRVIILARSVHVVGAVGDQ
jgi:hypothetical protein